MKKYNTIIIISSIGIVLVAMAMIAATYAYFSLNITGTGNNMSVNALNDDISITYTDTSNVTLLNAYTGEHITKTFSVANSSSYSAYYNIELTELVNNFGNPDDLVFTLSSTNNGANRNETVIPTITNSMIAADIKIDAGVTQVYTLIVTFLKTTEDQSNNMNKTFSAKINIISSEHVGTGLNNIYGYSQGTLGYTILGSTITNSASLDYSVIPSSNGIYSTNNSIDGTTIYYYRGDATNTNNVLFADKCWKIIRTTEDLGIRMIYNGEPTGESPNETCVNTTESTTNVSSTVFNSNSTYNAYVGYKYGSPNSSTYNSEHANTNNSTIKTALENWYSSTLSSYSSYIDDSVYCNNRKTHTFTNNSILYGITGYSNNNTGYSSYYNININTTSTPDLNCNNKKDILTVSNERGISGTISQPIGLITADEAVLAGYTKSTAYSDSYLNNGYNYWTMTPAYYYSTSAYNYYISSGSLSTSPVNTTYYLRPVITLKSTTSLISGDGTTSTPYKITN